nr:hypothetical protein [Tanacetum cinerariifolium]
MLKIQTGGGGFNVDVESVYFVQGSSGASGDGADGSGADGDRACGGGVVERWWCRRNMKIKMVVEKVLVVERIKDNDESKSRKGNRLRLCLATSVLVCLGVAINKRKKGTQEDYYLVPIYTRYGKKGTQGVFRTKSKLKMKRMMSNVQTFNCKFLVSWSPLGVTVLISASFLVQFRLGRKLEGNGW